GFRVCAWESPPGYTLTYDGNGATGGSPPAPQTGLSLGASATLASSAATLSKPGYYFAGWNTAANGAGTDYAAGASYPVTGNATLYAKWAEFTLAEQMTLVDIPALDNFTGSGSNGVFVSGRTVSLSAFEMAKYETTYELWYEVRTWALNHGYTFYRPGQEGHDGTPGAAPTSAKTEPVTMVSWRDVIVWCNAYSEKEGKTPVYYTDAGFSTPLRVSTFSSVDEENPSPGSEDNPYVKWDASGYRLPTDLEWELAARGGDPTNPAWNYTYAGSNTIGDVAWYNGNAGGATHPVRAKAANRLGLYDMSGNVQEYCWDWFSGTITASTPLTGKVSYSSAGRSIKGGSFYNGATTSVVTDRNYAMIPRSAGYNCGFRVCTSGD
ncbi:MAG: SUMF1/EgtB/PvdO family nonheme iron enzyme, partial [Treponema sp.]|nr:SUMF1/EgtB/PvdO family nonheme iron enzyme [Treponema sp.]